ncbi:hypothetical protein [Archangium sp. Cb G35]|uniref:hypothetical protein n=1 Tax=Archangium sp. Cb G35 TaxID=1920190 RepID=UPI0011611E89|nr:hypothetical protein [Archangium sp. Cb G35]
MALPASSWVTELRIGSAVELQSLLNRVDTLKGPVSLTVEPHLLSAPELRALQLRPEVQVFVLDPDGLPLPTYPLRPDMHAEQAVQYSPSLLVKLPEGARELPDFRALESKPFSREDTYVAALFDESDTSNQSTLSELERATRNNLDIVATRNIEPLFEKARGKILLLIGHAEAGRFVIDSVDGGVLATFDIQELVGLAEKYDVALYNLGCETGHLKGVAGYRDEINSLALASQLEHALDASTLAEFFRRLGSPSQPMIVDLMNMDKTLVLIQAHLANRGEVVTVRPSVVYSVSKSRPPAEPRFRFTFRYLLELSVLLYVVALCLAPRPVRFVVRTVYWIFAIPSRLIRAGWRAIQRWALARHHPQEAP